MRWHFPNDSRWLERALKALLVLSASLLAVCGLFAYLFWRSFAPHTVFVSESPDGRSYVRVTEAWTVSDSRIRVFLSGAGWEREVADKEDCSLNFGHVAWSPDSKRIAIFCNLSYCGDLKMGWDTSAGQPLPFEQVAPLLREDIANSYSVSPTDLIRYGGDPIRWATDYGNGHRPPGIAAFGERHPRSFWTRLLPW
jgi:hypothetical protein